MLLPGVTASQWVQAAPSGIEPVNPAAEQVDITVESTARQTWDGYGWGGDIPANSFAVRNLIQTNQAQLFDELRTKVIRLHNPQDPGFVANVKPMTDFGASKGVDRFLATGYVWRNINSGGDYTPTALADAVHAAIVAGVPFTHCSLQNEPDGHPDNHAPTSMSVDCVPDITELRDRLDALGHQVGGLSPVKVIGLEWAHFNAGGVEEYNLLSATGQITSLVSNGAGHCYRDCPSNVDYDDRWALRGRGLWSTETGNAGSPNAQARSCSALNHGAEVEVFHIGQSRTTGGDQSQFLVDSSGGRQPWQGGMSVLFRDLERGAVFRRCTSSDRPAGLPVTAANLMLRDGSSQLNPRIQVAAAKQPGGAWIILGVNATDGATNVESIFVNAGYAAALLQMTLTLPEPVTTVLATRRASKAGTITTGSSNMVSGVVRFTLQAGETIRLLAQGRTFYVAPSGNNSNPGSEAQPFLTINGAISAVSPSLGAGDALVIEDGTYPENVIVNRGGSSAGQLTIVARNRGGALIRPTGGNHGVHIQKDYVTLDGFDVSGPDLLYHGITADRLDGGASTRGVHHITIRHCTSHDNTNSGIGLAYGDYYTVEHCLTYGNCHSCPQGIQGSGISIYQARAFDAASGFHNVVRWNVTHGNQILRLTNGVGGPQYTPFPSAEPAHTDGNGIIIDDFRNSQTTPGSGTIFQHLTLIENNLSYLNGGKGIQVFKSNNVVLRNNTLWSNLRDTLSTATFCDELSNSQGSFNVWVNNIGVVVGTTYTAQQNGATITRRAIGDRDISADRNVATFWAGNLTYDQTTPGSNSMIMSQTRTDATLTEAAATGPTGLPAGLNLFAENPLFVSTGTADFSLQSGSPALNKGTAVYGLATLDLDGNPRVVGAAIDIGCYERP